MDLFYYKSDVGNFGDDLNPWLWDRVFPGLFNCGGEYTFLGIGSILDKRLDSIEKKIIFGSGVRGLKDLPCLDYNTRIYALRGGLSAKALGLDKSFAVTDPAVLVKKFHNPSTVKCFKYSYMPYFRSATSGRWQKVCEESGLNFIDPRGSVDDCLDSISKSDFLITEAMHGAILADTFRVPWSAVQSFNLLNEGQVSKFKWTDWLSTLSLDFEPTVLPVLWPCKEMKMVGRAKNYIKEKLVKKNLQTIISDQKFFLSKEGIVEKHIEKYEEIISKFKADFLIR